MARLRQILTFLSPGREHEKKLPTFDELPSFHEYTGCAWSIWGENDQLGTINLLTEDVVKRAAAEEIRAGQTVSLNWPINFPNKPMFNRKTPEVNMIKGAHGAHRDDEIHINTQSGSQWDGMRHFGVAGHNVFYNNTHMDSMPAGIIPIANPRDIDPALSKIGIQSTSCITVYHSHPDHFLPSDWATHGICGRGVLLDLVSFYGDPLPYDPWTSHPIPVKDLEACARKQGVTFRRGDILILRVGFIRKFMDTSTKGEERDALGAKPETFAGLEQGEDMKRFLWDHHFAAAASDQPALERWPTPEGVPHLHQTILGMWGMPIGEMFDLEKLAEICLSHGRYTFFFSSWPLPIIGGCASPPNAAAFF